MGKPFGIPVYVAPSWFVVAALITVVFAPVVDARLPGLGPWRYLVSFAFAVLLYLSVLVHELAHSVVARKFGLPVRRISLYLLGGISEISKEPETPGREFLIAFAGPVLSLTLGGTGILFATVVGGSSQLAGVLNLLIVELTVANILVALFNLLPGLPLDGGRMLRAGVWKISGRPFLGTMVAAWAGRGVAVLVFLAPLLRALIVGRPPQIIDIILGGLIGSFIWFGAAQAIQSAKVRAQLPSLRIRALVRQALSVPADLPVSEVLRRAQEAGVRGVVIVDSAGQPTAVVSEAAVIATPEQRRPWVPVSNLARGLEPGLILSTQIDGEQLLAALRSTPATEYLVTEPTGEICGVLATADVERMFATT